MNIKVVYLSAPQVVVVCWYQVVETKETNPTCFFMVFYYYSSLNYVCTPNDTVVFELSKPT